MIRWVYAFVDRPKESFERAAEFWTAVTGTSLSARRGPGGEFATLAPPRRSHRDACVKIQGVDDGHGGAHLDFAVEDVRAMAARAVELGARVVPGADDDDEDLAVLEAPGGHLFCAVRWHGEAHKPDVFEGTRLDQVCLDIAPEVFEGAVEFWGELTGWPVLTSSHAEFRMLRSGPQLPLRILLQRLDSPTRPGDAHLDFACQDRAATRVAHEKLGAEFEAEQPGWIVMRDPAGARYCLTARDPRTGSLT
jgi:predicted enzyme related to lactoylglutathione lyase